MLGFVLTLLLAAQEPQDLEARLQEVARQVAEENYDAALATLQGLRASGTSDVRIELLAATCLNRLGRWAEAVPILDAALQTSPERAELWFERGTAKLQLRDYAAAREDLQHAIDLHYPNPGYANALLAAALAGLGERDAAAALLQQAQEDLPPESAMYRTADGWRDRLSQLTRAHRPDRAGLTLSFGGGWTENALHTSDDDALPGGVTNRESAYTTLRARAWWDVVSDGTNRVRLSARPDYRQYEETRSASFLQFPATAEYSRRLSGTLTGRVGFTFSNSWLFHPDRKLSRTLRPYVGASYRWTDTTTTHATLAWSDTRYSLSGLDGARNPDHTAWSLRVEQPTALDDRWRWWIVPSVGFRRQEADGSDWDGEMLDLGLSLAWRPLEQVTLSTGAYASFSSYDHPHSLSASGRRRHDDVYSPYVQAEWSPTEWLTITAGATETFSGSSIARYDYDAAEAYGFVSIEPVELIRALR